MKMNGMIKEQAEIIRKTDEEWERFKKHGGTLNLTSTPSGIKSTLKAHDPEPVTRNFLGFRR